MLIFYKPSETTGYQPVEDPSEMGELLIFSEGFMKTDAKYLVDKYGFAKHLLDDVFDTNELPRIEIEEGLEYIFLRTFEPNGKSPASHPLLFIISENILACLSTNKRPTNELITLPEPGDKPLTHRRMLLKGIFSIVKQYEEIIDSIGANISSIERRMRSHEATNQDFFSFVSIEGSLNRASMGLIGLSTVVEKLTTSTKAKVDHELLDDIVLFSKQLQVEINSHLQTIKSIREAYSTVANNTLNQRMKILTTITLLVALPNLFYSMYGMNLSLPFMHEPWAYPLILLFSILIIFIVYAIAKHKKLV